MPQIFSVLTALEKFENETTTVDYYFGFVLRILELGNHLIIKTSSLAQIPVFKMQS